MNNIKKAVMGGVAGATMLASTIMPVLAAKPNPSANNGLMMNGQSEVRHLELYQKDYTDPTWPILDNGTSGKMTFDTDSFVFNGKGLEAGVEYSLINYAPSTDWSIVPYPNPYPGSDSVLLGSAVANNGGSLHIKGDLETPIIGKVWLVLEDDFVEGIGMTGWNPGEYLFEYDLIK